MADKKKKKQASLGCLFWIAFILLIIVLFFFNKNIIKTNISNIFEKTGASSLFSANKPAAGQPADGKTPPAPQLPSTTDTKIAPDTTPVSGDGSKEPEAPAPEAVTQPDKTAPASPASGTATKPAETPATQTKPATVKPAPTPKPAAAIKPQAPVAKPETAKAAHSRKVTLFFVSIDADGRVLRKETTRDIPQGDSPLSETLQVLFKGTTPAETGKGFRSLIPQGTQLLSATVKNGVATLNLSEDFQFNQFGIEGYLGQLSQIVFTATAFPTVTSVQFLIEGQRREYLGAEGVWIGTPLSRDKFQ